MLTISWIYFQKSGNSILKMLWETGVGDGSHRVRIVFRICTRLLCLADWYHVTSTFYRSGVLLTIISPSY